MKRVRQLLNKNNLVLGFILLIAFLLRINGYDWDGFKHYHPDERYLIWVGTTIEFSLDGILDPHESSFNPYYWGRDAQSEGLKIPQGEDRRFAYGHLPLYLVVAASKPLTVIGEQFDLISTPDDGLIKQLFKPDGLIEYNHLLVVGRLLTALIGTGSVLLVYLIGTRVFGKLAGLLAAASQSLAVIAIQSAHFFIVDPYMVFFLLAAALFFMVYLQEGKLRWIGMTGAAWGLAIGCKFTSVFFLIPIVIILIIKKQKLQTIIIFSMVLITFALLCFAVTNPYSLLDWTCEGVAPPDMLGFDFSRIDLGLCYAENVFRQQRMASGSFTYPFTHQYDGTLPFLYQIGELFKWGLGPLLTIGVILAFGYYLIMLFKKKIEESNLQILFLLIWLVVYFGLTGGMFVKFLRYSLPMLPFLFILLGGWIINVKSWKIRWIITASIIIPTLFYAIVFVMMYGQPHPWLAAADWAEENLEAGALIVEEKWDQQNLLSTRSVRVDWLTTYSTEDNIEKVEGNLRKIQDADYYVIASNRIYGVVGTQTGKYPLSSQFYALLFSGELGFELVYAGTRSPQLFGVDLVPARFTAEELEDGKIISEKWLPDRSLSLFNADESFTVYDQPFILIFKNSGKLSYSMALGLFEIP